MYLLLLFYVLCMAALATAQFGSFFEGMFGQHQQQQPRGGASQWAAHMDSISCSQYLCPTTLDCVPRPLDCPCPYIEDVKCLLPDSEGQATVVCVRGEKGCQEVESLANRIP